MFLFYFLKRIVFYLFDFFNTYYLGSFHFFLDLYQNLIYQIEKKLGFFVNLRHLTTPLWSIYSLGGYLISIPIRIFKVLIGGFVLVFFSIISCLIYLLWVILPVYLILKTISP
ncbi:MAG TPA: hypothetical protein PL164_00735 [Candidatus Paceibacterota bacterium]|nr:hypothetical protein [Candidatus Paceibacterota bacterium]HOK97303.1 hypothetical protein [Candidatus Paceibacterota bacterium]